MCNRKGFPHFSGGDRLVGVAGPSHAAIFGVAGFASFMKKSCAALMTLARLMIALRMSMAYLRADRQNSR